MTVLNEPGTLTPMHVADGVSARILHSEQMSMGIIDLAPNAVVPEHHHINEQIGVVVLGSAQFIVAGTAKHMTAGSSYYILPDVPHKVIAGPEGAFIIECFTPVRDEWRTLAPSAVPSPRWPAGS
jgi:quercetin dioxygenase-like cupin family protein